MNNRAPARASRDLAVPLTEPSPGLVYTFGPFRLDVTAHRLSRDGQEIALASKALGTLAMLVKHHTRVVEKDELMREVWHDAFVSEDSLTQDVSFLRRALGDDSSQPADIATVARRGYRFIAPVTQLSPDSVAPIRRRSQGHRLDSLSDIRYKLTHMSSVRTVVRAAVVALAIASTTSPLAAQNAADDHPAQYPAADVTAGSRVYGTLCVTCHGPTGAGVSGVDLRRGPIRRGTTDAALRAFITTGAPATGMPSFKLDPAELTGLVAIIRAGLDAATNITAVLGDAMRGRTVLEGKGQCLTCHRVGERGVDSAPDLTDIGRLRTPAALQLSLLDPSRGMQPINRPVRAVKRDGTVILGRRLNEDMYTVQIIATDGRLVSLVKPDLREWKVETVSTMPSYKDTLTSTELGDLVSYLMSLEGARP